MIIYQDKSILKDCENVTHGFFGRQGGVSKGIYASLNCGQGSNDDQNDIFENRRRVLNEMSGSHLVSVHQIHSEICYRIDISHDKNPQGDAMVTDKAGLALCILTADCAPVLFVGNKVSDNTPVIGAAHAGWGGAFKGVLENTVQKMIEIGADIETISAAIGPCIGQKSYEVGDEFYDRFIEQSSDNDLFFKSGVKKNKYHFDLSGYCAYRLMNAGVRKSSISGVNTYEENERCFSYRRTTHNQENDYGRQASVICIKH